MKLYECVAEYRAQLDALAELDLDATTYSDTLESIQGPVQDKLRAVIAYSLDLEIEATGLPEISTDEWAAKVAKKPPAVVIADGIELPSEYVRTTVKTEPDKAALKAALTAGTVVPGVSLVAGHRIQIR